MNEKSKLVIFDFDGVIVDSIDVMFKNMQKLFPGLTWEEFQKGSKKSIKERDEYFARHHKRLSKRDAEKLQKSYAKEKLKTSKAHDEMRMLIRDLSKKYFLAINTNAREDNILPILKSIGVYKYFDSIEPGGDSRTKVDKSESIMSELSISPSDAVFITDTTGDVLDAEEAGMPAIAVTWGVHGREDFEEGEVADGLIAVVESSDELYDAISDHFD